MTQRLRHPQVYLPVIAFVAFFVAWQVLPTVGAIPRLFTSTPWDVAQIGWVQVQNPRFYYNIYISGLTFTVGFFSALAVAIPFGLVTGWYKRLHYLVDPPLTALNSLPRLALLPLVVLWLGFGLSSKFLIVFLGAFFPIAVNVFHAVSTIDRNLSQVAEAYGASERVTFRTLVIPTTVPFITSGARIGVGRAISGVVVAEFYGATAGLAHQMFFDANSLRTDSLFFHLFVLTAIAMLAFRYVRKIDARFEHWRPVKVEA